MRAGLLFRTGVADETLATVGITHLIEHLALSSINDPLRRHNGRKALGGWGDFVPLIAEFLTDDADKIEARKQQIRESEWKRIEEIATAAFERPASVRDGRPIPLYQYADAQLKAERRS